MLIKQTTMKQLKKDIKFIGNIVRRVTGGNPFANDRTRDNVDARFIVYKLSRDFLKVPYTRIGKALNRNHATVLYGCKQVDFLVETDNEFRRNYNACLKIMVDTDLTNVAVGEVDFVDLVETKTELKNITEEYESLKKELEIRSWDMIQKAFADIEFDVIRGVMNDRNCPFQLNRTLKKVLVNKIK